MSQRIRFTVTQEHIDKGCSEHDAIHNCPIARALNEARPGEEWQVLGAITGHRRGDVFSGPISPATRWTLSVRACRFIRAFDAKRPVAPFTAEIYR